MRSKNPIILSCIFILILSLGSIQKVPAQDFAYSPAVTPTPLFTKTLEWRINNVTSEVVEWGFGSGAFWQANENQHIIFDIHQLADTEVHGIFTIGNLTIPTNDSRIAAELAFSIWPWFPGLISHLTWATVDQRAADAASGLLVGELEILTTTTTKSYIYHQAAPGNQNTTLIYDKQTGILLEGYTEFFFLNDYHLGVELVRVTQVPTDTTYFVVLLAVIFVILIFTFVLRRSSQRN
ncbi:MAG: hypothetical protein ACFFCW_27785 [Candidatus Hodarchaeota archaeon]